VSETNEIAAALAKAQGAFSNPERNKMVRVATRAGATYTFTYATLDAIMDMVRGPLSANGLAVSHVLVSDESGWRCITRLLHSSGQSIECPVPVLVDQDANAQGWGSAITYAKRYGLCALLAITADEDDDGNAASANAATEQAKKPAASKAGGFKQPPQQAAKQPAQFRYSTATSAEKRKFTLGRISEAVANSDPVQARAKLNEIAAKAVGMDPADADVVASALHKAEQDLDAECASGQ
jgi:hypothetical protein